MIRMYRVLLNQYLDMAQTQGGLGMQVRWHGHLYVRQQPGVLFCLRSASCCSWRAYR
jgi:hypothetical protein